MLWSYRVATMGNLRPFHYLLPVMVPWAVGFGFVTDRILERWRWSRRWPWPALLTWVGLVHLASLWSVADARAADAAQYRPLREVHEVLAALEPGQRIGLLEGPSEGPALGWRLQAVHGLSAGPFARGRRSRLQEEFRELFAYAPPGAVGEGTPVHHSTAVGSFAVIDQPR
jgi:hypothetical protein